MVSKEIINQITNANKEFVYNIVNDRPIFKEDVKNLIVDMLRNCEDDEVEWILDRLNAEY